MIAYDIETTGVDLWHGCRPFAATAVRDDGEVFFRQWSVDPYTREVYYKPADIEALLDFLSQDEIVCHNASFDIRGSELLLKHPDLQWDYSFDWDCIEDTMLASHALRNLWSHGLKSLRSVLLFQGNATVDLLQQAVNHARRICRRQDFIKKHGHWRLANKNDPHWPAIKSAPGGTGESGWWLFDMWLPAAVVELAPEFLPSEHDYDSLLQDPDYHGYFIHPWENLLEEYNIQDAMSTLVLWEVLHDALQQEGLWDQYRERKQLLEVCYRTETTGITLLPRIKQEIRRYEGKAKSLRYKAEKRMRAAGFNNSNSGKQLQAYLFGHLKLSSHKKTTGGNPATDAETLERLRDGLELTNQATHNQHHAGTIQFLDDLLLSRRNTKASQYLTSYLNWSTPDGEPNIFHRRLYDHQRDGTSDQQNLDGYSTESKTQENHDSVSGWYGNRLHSTIRVTGTRFTRQSTSDPNLQNVGTGKEEGDEIDYRLRLAFGPRRGRVWLALDYSNIELRIWAYLCGNREFIQAFEQGESIHLLIARELHRELRTMSDDEAKRQKSYKHTKNGNFAIIYGATPAKADATYKVHGAYQQIAERFPEVRTFTQQLHNEVARRGYIETLTGYRLYIPPGDPHKAVSGKIQGTAGSVIGRAMLNCYWFLYNWYPEGNLILQVHDELLFDVPTDFPDWLSGELSNQMSGIGEAIEIPLEVGCDIIRENWAEGEKL